MKGYLLWEKNITQETRGMETTWDKNAPILRLELIIVIPKMGQNQYLELGRVGTTPKIAKEKERALHTPLAMQSELGNQ